MNLTSRRRAGAPQRPPAWLGRRRPRLGRALRVTTVTCVLTAGASVLTAGASVLTAGASVPAGPVRGAAAAPGHAARPDATSFRGTPAVGALFIVKHGRLTHFCTASVVRSKHQDLLITAAHCMLGKKLRPAGTVVFAPGYHAGKFPHGRWEVRVSYTDRRWRRDQDPNDDVAFLIAGRPGRRVQKYTGGETLDATATLPRKVKVIGYPDTAAEPVTCTGQARAFDRPHLRQLVFDCAGYTDGTSGGPFLARVSRATGEGRVIGVIGGYEQGGDQADVSYSSRFLAEVAALYRQASR